MTLVLLRHTDNPDKMVALAARRCYSSRKAEDIAEKMTDEETQRMINMLKSRGHLSVFEHVVFTFSADGISRALSHQLVRHRIASYSQESQRYVNYSKLDNIPCVVPPKIKENKEAEEIFQKAVQQAHEAYKILLNSGIKPEDARYVFPNAVETKVVFTMNARSLFNFFEQRCCMRAQWEIRQLANEMLAAVKKVAPLIFKDAGAPCRQSVHPYCREEDTTCPCYKLMQKNLK